MNHYDKLAQEMLRSLKGREALGRLLGCEILEPGKSQEKDQKPIVAALVPCYDHPEPRMQDAFIQMQKASQGHCTLYPGPPVSSSVIHWSRNWLIAELIKSQKPWTHALFIDDDIVAPPDALVKMLAHKKDIVAALCTRRVDPPIPNIREYNEKTGEFREQWQWPENQLIEVGAAGTGMMLISRHALEQVAETYFRCLYEREVYKISDELAEQMQQKRLKHFDESGNAFWFRFLPNLDGTFEMGEDVSFCFVARRYAKIPVYCDTSVQCGHVGAYVYSIPDFLPYRAAAIEKAKAEQRCAEELVTAGADGGFPE